MSFSFDILLYFNKIKRFIKLLNEYLEKNN
jgi:hypothetical protein